MSNPPEFDPATHVDTMAAALDMPIDPAHRDKVVLNMGILHTMSRHIMGMELPTDLEGAPVFTPGEVQS